MKVKLHTFLLPAFFLCLFCCVKAINTGVAEVIHTVDLKKTTVLGNQLIVELYGCDRECIDDVCAIEQVMLDAARAAHTTIVEHRFHKFSPQGVSGVVILQESHLAIHTWPEFGYCAIDAFTCGEAADPLAAVELLKNAFKATSTRIFEVERGLDT